MESQDLSFVEKMVSDFITLAEFLIIVELTVSHIFHKAFVSMTILWIYRLSIGLRIFQE